VFRTLVYDVIYDMRATIPASRTIDYGALAKEVRRARGLTQEQLARELDVTFGTVNSWERGRHEPIPALGKRIVEFAAASGIRNLPRKPARRSLPTGPSAFSRRGRAR
jgi:putative transcriptional regulator